MQSTTTTRNKNLSLEYVILSYLEIETRTWNLQSLELETKTEVMREMLSECAACIRRGYIQCRNQNVVYDENFKNKWFAKL